MNLDAYLHRIGYEGAVEATYDCLARIHRCQALAVPYENIDIQLGYGVSSDIACIFDKIVNRRRGGWCYETNGLLQWALEQIGFNVMRMTGGVRRRERGESAMGGHVVLLVSLDKPYVADLGLGDGIREPILMEEGFVRQGSLEFRLERLDDGCWRLHNHSFGIPTSADFRPGPADEDLLADKCNHLQTSEDSAFVQNLAVKLMKANTITTVIGRVLSRKSADNSEKTLIGSPEEMEKILADHFGITGVSISPAWPKILSRHRQLFGDNPIGNFDPDSAWTAPRVADRP